MEIKLNSLAVYKNNPARVIKVGDKLEIELSNKTTKRVRSKDLQLIHTGPISNLNILGTLLPTPEEIKDTRELLLESSVDLSEFAELVFGENIPTTAWAAWELLCDGTYFKGTFEKVEARTEEEVAETFLKKEAKIAGEQERQELLDRIKNNNILPDDAKNMREIEQVALGQTSKSRLMQELKQEQIPEKAHALLLKTGFWNSSINPYPQRFNIDFGSLYEPDIPVLPQENRRDLTHLETFAIDDEDCSDPDDALSFEDGCLWVHIADVAAIVQPGSDLDLYAITRGTNLYLPEKTIPMLPAEVTQILGLGLNEVSPALSFKMKLDDESNAKIEEIVPSLVRVKQLSYEEANNKLDSESLKNIQDITRRFKEKRLANGAVEINLPEVKVKKTDDSILITPVLSLDSRKLVTEAMLMTGEAVALFAMENEICIPFASQNILGNVNPSDDLAGMFACRRKFKRAVLQTMSEKHSGLGLEHYTRVTSPLRRYLDLLVHQQLRAYLRNDSIIDEETISYRIAAVRTAVMNNVTVERNSNRHWTLVYMDAEKWTGEAILVDKYENKGTFIVPELAFETRLAIDKEMKLNSKVVLSFNGCDLSTLTGNFMFFK